MVSNLWKAMGLAAGVVAMTMPCVAEDGPLEDGPLEESVKPGINERWKGDDVEGLVGSLERDGREISDHREALAKLVNPKPGTRMADVGAGSGFMVEAFAPMVGPEGKVYGVDINALMMERLAQRAEETGLSQVETVVCTERSVELPKGSVDLIFMADTYHHFEYPQSTLASIREALVPGGDLWVVDFERIEGVSDEWIFDHVRLDKQGTIDEVTAHGFELVGEVDAPFLVENYVLRFRRPME